jgi:hypothetical protein
MDELEQLVLSLSEHLKPPGLPMRRGQTLAGVLHKFSFEVNR